MLSVLAARDHGQVYLACGATNTRKSMDGLAALVTYGFELDPFGPSLFVFCNRGRDKLKILFWDNNGFWLFYRRLETGRFPWSDDTGSGPRTIDRRQLQWRLDGLELEQSKTHAPITFTHVPGNPFGEHLRGGTGVGCDA